MGLQFASEARFGKVVLEEGAKRRDAELARVHAHKSIKVVVVVVVVCLPAYLGYDKIGRSTSEASGVFSLGLFLHAFTSLFFSTYKFSSSLDLCSFLLSPFSSSKTHF